MGLLRAEVWSALAADGIEVEAEDVVAKGGVVDADDGLERCSSG